MTGSYEVICTCSGEQFFVRLSEDDTIELVRTLDECTRFEQSDCIRSYEAITEVRKLYPNLPFVIVCVPKIVFRRE